MSRDLAEIVQDLRVQLAKRGDASISTLARAFKINDHDRSGYFDFEEFETIMSRVGLFLKRQELAALFRHFDVNSDKRINYNEFLRGVQGQMNGRRVGIVRQAFQKLDRDGSGVLDQKDIVGLYNAQSHPKVLSGEKTEAQVLNEFLMSFEGAGGNNDGQVTWEEFADYYAAISASIPYDDEYFATVMERAWGIKEDESALDDVPPSLLAKIENVIREKVRQKTRAGKPESNTLKAQFNFFDIDNSGTVIFDEFVKALGRLGVVLDENVARALFRAFDANDNGRISYQEFVGRLYQVGNVSSDVKLSSTSAVSGQTQYLDGSSILVSAGSASSNAPKLVKVLFLMGGPCSGKSTQAARLTTEFNFVHIDVAYLLQVESESGTSPEAEALRQAIDQGVPVSSDVTVAIIQQAIESNVAEGRNFFVLDGFPRSPENIQAWQRQCSAYDVPAVIFLDAPVEILERRVGDAPGGAGRLQQFQNVTLPLTAYFADARKLRAVSAVAQPELVYEAVRKVVRSL